MSYVDGFLIPVPKKNLAAYRAMSRAAGKVWREFGALEYRECAGDDIAAKSLFTRMTRLKPGETVVFSWVNAKVMKDPRIATMMEGKAMPFDVKRMAYGGFSVFVDM